MTKSNCVLSLIGGRLVRHTTAEYNYENKGRYTHAWKHTNSNEEINSLQSDRVTRYNCPTSGHVLVFSGSSEIRRLNELRKKELAKLATLEDDRPVERNEKNTILPASQALLFPDDGIESDSIELSRERRTRALYKFSKKSAAKIRDYAQCFTRAGAKSFITLTFVNAVSDRKAMRCFSSYMQNWRLDGKEPHYIMVMERQENNKKYKGNPHFHILTREYVDIEKENTRWIRIQYNNGIYMPKPGGGFYERSDVERFARNNRFSKQHCKMNGLRQIKDLANPFDITKIDNADGASNYITKYIAKSVREGLEYGCKPWSCSVSISKMYKRALCMPELFDAAISEKNVLTRQKDWVNKKTREIIQPAGSKITPVIIENAYATTVSVVNKSFFHKFLKDMDDINRRFLDTGILEPTREIAWIDYYHEFCRDYSPDEVALSREEYRDMKVYSTDKLGMMRKFTDCFSEWDNIIPGGNCHWEYENYTYNGMSYTKYKLVET